jgi:hypothetical protein
MNDRTEIQENLAQSQIELRLDLAAVTRALMEAGVAVDRVRLLAPIIAEYGQGLLGFANLQEEGRQSFELEVLNRRDRSERRLYAAMRADGGCCFSAEEAMGKAKRLASREYMDIIETRQDRDRERLQLLTQMGLGLLQSLLTMAGEQRLQAPEVLKKLLPLVQNRGLPHSQDNQGEQP